MVTISVLLAYSDLSLTPRLADLSQTPDKWQTRFLEARTTSRKKCRSLEQLIHKLPTVLSAIDTLNPCISAIDRDIEIIQKVTSMAWLPLCSEWILMTKFLVSYRVFLPEKLKFHLRLQLRNCRLSSLKITMFIIFIYYLLYNEYKIINHKRKIIVEYIKMSFG